MVDSPRSRRRQGGAALLIFLIIAVIGALAFILDGLSPEEAKTQRGGQTGEALAQAKEALLAYALTYRDQHPDDVYGFLPCPDTNGDGYYTPLDNCDSQGTNIVGLLPFKTLGLPDLRDENGNCLWYAVSGSFKVNPAGVLNWDTQGQFEVRDAGNSILAALNDVRGGAAAVIFAPGAPVGDRTRTTTTSASRPCGLDSPAYGDFIEDKDGATYTFPGTAGATTTVYQASTSSTGNDRVAWLSPKEIFDRVKKHSDFGDFISNGIAQIKAYYDTSLPSPAGVATTLPATNPFSPFTANYYFYANWADNFRYLACSPAGSYCYQGSDGNMYDGVLLFGGADVSDAPRASTARTSANYFEAGNALTLAGGSTAAPCSTAAAVFDSSSAASRAMDFALCLKQEPAPPPFTPTVITGTGDFAVAATSALVANSATTVVLGSATGSSTPRAGCTWFPDMVNFEKGIRVYFSFEISTLAVDSGFMFALADASTNPTTIGLCGGTDKYLGYAATDSSLTPGRIAAPKIGLEFDTRRDGTTNAPDSLISLTRHLSFVYWGTEASDTDDNMHKAGTSGSLTQPQNPYVTGQGIRSWNLPTGTTTYHVRLDITRNYNAATQTGSYTMTAYLLRNTSAQLPGWPNCNLSDVANLDAGDLSSVNPDCATRGINISRTISIDDSVSGGSEAMKQIFLGFTTGQRGFTTAKQQIVISGFEARNHQ
jgi:hypothetical protein